MASKDHTPINPVVVKGKKLSALNSDVLVTEMNFKERISNGGIIILGDDGKAEGIRPRWGKVYAVGPTQNEVLPGQWVLVNHGRWTRGMPIVDDTGEHTLRKIDPNDMLAVSDEVPQDDSWGNAVSGY